MNYKEVRIVEMIPTRNSSDCYSLLDQYNTSIGVMWDHDICDVYEALTSRSVIQKTGVATWQHVDREAIPSPFYRTFELSKDKEMFTAKEGYFYPGTDMQIEIFIPRRLMEEVVILYKLKKSMA